ncbi:MAG: hypothetical protein V1684_03025 [bacterium]
MKNPCLKFFLFFFLLFWPFFEVSAGEYDLGLSSSDIWFSKTKFFAGEKVKIYAQVKNSGSKDVSAYVIFYEGQTTIGEPQPISVVAGGTEDAVWVDWLAEAGPNDITVRIVGQMPADSNSDNDSIVLPIEIDIDTDNDGLGNKEDLDDDNDGLSDTDEAGLKISPLNPDTDADGVIDSQDAYPLDSTKSVKEAPKPTPKPIATKPRVEAKVEASRQPADEPVSPTGEVSFFEFESERLAKIKDEQAAEPPLAVESVETEENNWLKINFSKNFYLIIILIFGLLIYFFPQLAKLRQYRKNNKRK